MRYVIAIALLLFSASAFAQSPGTVNLVGPSGSPGAPQITPGAVNAAVNAAFTAKADLSGLNAEITRAATAESLLLPLAGGVVSGPVTFESSLLFSGLSVGTQVACIGLDSGNHLVLDAAACGVGTGAVTWPTAADLILSNGTNTPDGLAPVEGDCVLGSGGAWVTGGCGGLATITIKDSAGNSITDASAILLGPGFLLSGSTPNGIVSLNQSTRLVTACGGTPDPCAITANDMGGEVDYSGANLTAVVPAFTSVTSTGTATTTALTLSSGTGVEVGASVSDAGGKYPPGTVTVSGSGTSWVTNNAPSSPISSVTLTIAFGGSGQGFVLGNLDATGLTISSTPVIQGYPPSTPIPQYGGLSLLSNGSTLRGYGLGNQPNQAYVSANQTWSGQQTWGYSIGPEATLTGSAYTLSATDCGKAYDVNASVPFTVTTLATLPVNCTTWFTQTGSGQVTVVPGSGATQDGPGGISKTRVQWSSIFSRVDTNSGSNAHFVLGGDGS